MHRPAGRQEVVDDEHLLTRLDRVAMDLEGVRSVLERVLDGDRLGRELAQLAHGHEAGVELVGHRRAEDEAARLHADHDVDRFTGVRRKHQVDRLAIRRGVLEQRGDVVKEDAGLREVGDLADLRAQLLGRHGIEASIERRARAVSGGLSAPKVYRRRRDGSTAGR